MFQNFDKHQETNSIKGKTANCPPRFESEKNLIKVDRLEVVNMALLNDILEGFQKLLTTSCSYFYLVYGEKYVHCLMKL